METKFCAAHNNREGAYLPITDFNKSKVAKSGLRSNCKKCESVATMKWREKNREKSRAASKRYFERHREFVRELQREWQRKDKRLHPEKYERWKLAAHLKRKFGITIADYERMLAEQGGACAICGCVPDSDDNRLAVDHCHKSKKNRGLLCVRCNTTLERIEGIENWIEKATAYLRRFQA